MTPDRIQPGSQVSLEFRIELEDGSVPLSSEDGPLDLTIGAGELPDGLEMALFGLVEGEQQRILLTPEQAWGLHDPSRVQQLPRSSFEAETPLEPGLILSFHTPDGQQFPGQILSINDELVTVDFNHPLAGHSIRFWVLILKIDNSGLKEDD